MWDWYEKAKEAFDQAKMILEQDKQLCVPIPLMSVPTWHQLEPKGLWLTSLLMTIQANGPNEFG